ncbi:hypothetical protein L207DRAFT_525528 [Hyaloscypha variabilis F]|uniref:Uncharacterized protein n=1 Tax=Hyaloscypha variabilis (strain UAMH 11265 / GT02V1 / F) TaxID=1149755 RepID=A0A2J6S074_HYAVF|nr:hypothetical protein L207DRAFT_525528 [Hyaloscypha variabilis F]
MGCSPNVNFGRERIAGCGCEYFIVGEGGRPGSERRGSRGGKRRKALSRASSEVQNTPPAFLSHWLFVNQHCWSCPGAPSALGSLDLQGSRAARSEQTGTQNRTEKTRTGTAHGHNRPQTRSSSPGSLQLPTTVQYSNRTGKARQASSKPRHPGSSLFGATTGGRPAGKIIGGVGVGGVGLLVLVELVVLASPGPAPSPCSPENHPGKPLGPWPLRESQQHSARAASRDQTAARVRSAPEREEEEQEEEERRIGRDPESQKSSPSSPFSPALALFLPLPSLPSSPPPPAQCNNSKLLSPTASLPPPALALSPALALPPARPAIHTPASHWFRSVIQFLNLLPALLHPTSSLSRSRPVSRSIPISPFFFPPTSRLFFGRRCRLQEKGGSSSPTLQTQLLLAEYPHRPPSRPHPSEAPTIVHEPNDFQRNFASSNQSTDQIFSKRQ